MIFKIITDTINELLPMILLLIVTLSLMRFFELKNINRRIYVYDEIISLLFIIYTIILFTFLSKTEINTMHGFNIIPFDEISRYELGSKMFIYNVIGNIIAFIPFGLYFAYKLKNSRIWGIVASSTAISSLVEFIQYYIGRSFDVDDIILNVTGAVLGYFIFKILHKIYSKLPKFLQKESIHNIFFVLIIIALIIYIFYSMGVINFNELF